MARYGVLGDIHGNLEALVAALEALAGRGIERLFCLGDVIGYNADSDACAMLLRACGVKGIAGNHDLIGLGRLDFGRCSRGAEYSLRRTRRTLGRETAEWLASLPPNLVPEPGVVLVHGGVRDVQQYVKRPEHFRRNAQWLREDFPGARVCFFGHSHDQAVWEVAGDEVRRVGEASPLALDGPAVYFVNPGSVDAQRKPGRKLAECAVFDSGAGAVEFLRMPYDDAATESKAARGGYRIGPLTDWAWRQRARLFARLRAG